MLAGLADVIDAATAAFEAYDHTRALEVDRELLLEFCDDYLELVKARAYDGVAPGEAVDAFGDASPCARSARAALTVALETFLLLFAPVLPFSTEEVWSWWRDGFGAPCGLAVVRSPARCWRRTLTSRRLRIPPSFENPAAFLASAGAAFAALRKLKSEAKVSQRTEIVRVELLVPESSLAAVRAAEADLTAGARVRSLTIVAVPDTGPDGSPSVITTRGAELAAPE